jgi:hypothetical protein
MKSYCNRGVETLDAIKWRKFLDQLKYFSLTTRILLLVVIGINLKVLGNKLGHRT